jgi:hypothetical protein
LTIINGGETARTGGNNRRGVQEEACDAGSQKDVWFAQGKMINFIVTNTPGKEFSICTHAAGGIIGQNKIYKVAPSGLTIWMTSGAGMLLVQQRKLPGVQDGLLKQAGSRGVGDAHGGHQRHLAPHEFQGLPCCTTREVVRSKVEGRW